MAGIFLKLLNMSITAGWLILAVLILRLLLKKAPKWVSCLLWGIVAVRLVCPFSLESAWSLIPSAKTVVSNAVQDDVVRDDAVQDNVAHDNIVQNVQSGAEQGDAVHNDGVQNVQDGLQNPVPVIHSGVAVIDRTVNSVLSESFAADSAESGTGSSLWHYWTQIASVIWPSIAGCILLYALIGFLRLKRKVRASIRLHDNVYVCDEIPSPFILGIIKPHVYLPSGMDGETEKYVIAHENTHLHRLDHWWKPFGYILLAVYWFHPLSWVAYILFCRDMELACDEKAVQTMEREDKASYAQALLDCSFPRRMVVACPLAFGEIGVKERVKAVLNYKRPAFWIIIVALVACVAVAVCFLTDPKEADDDYPKEIANSLLIGDNIGEKYYLAAIDTDAANANTEDSDASDGLIDNGYWYTLELPDGYALSEYTSHITFGKGNLIEPQAYEYLGDTYNGPWTMSGFIEKIPDAQIFFRFKDGQIDTVGSAIGPRGEFEWIGPLNGLNMPAYLCSVTTNLYVSSDWIRFEELGIEPKDTFSSYWYIFFAREDLDEAFYLALDQRQFSQEEAIEIAKTVKFDLKNTADTEPAAEEFVPDPPVTTTKSIDFIVGAPVVDKQIFDWTDSHVLEAAEAYRDVLMEQEELCFFWEGKYMNSIKNLTQINEKTFSRPREIKRFTVIDLDNDNLPEVVLSFPEEQDGKYYESEYCILKYHDGIVYAYDRGIRGFNTLRMDGTFRWANSGFEAGIGTLLFQKVTTYTAQRGITETEDKVYSNTSSGEFLINGQSVTREEEQKAMDYQNSKPEAAWYEFTEENIKRYLSDARQ